MTKGEAVRILVANTANQTRLAFEVGHLHGRADSLEFCMKLLSKDIGAQLEASKNTTDPETETAAMFEETGIGEPRRPRDGRSKPVEPVKEKAAP